MSTAVASRVPQRSEGWCGRSPAWHAQPHRAVLVGAVQHDPRPADLAAGLRVPVGAAHHALRGMRPDPTTPGPGAVPSHRRTR